MTYDGVRYFAYDERRNLTLARQGALTAGNHEQDLYDALGARWYSARAATTIADTRRVELTDGLRPEVAVEEMINIPEGTTDQDAAGGRFSVMGPNPDERLIWIDATATALQIRYVHASRRRDARILSKGGAPERKYTYSALGRHRRCLEFIPATNFSTSGGMRSQSGRTSWRGFWALPAKPPGACPNLRAIGQRRRGEFNSPRRRPRKLRLEFPRFTSGTVVPP
ncbi:hypothetical protein [Caulobacter sp. NIBR1757]|uniref:hypothetical protein n=1 Tax=Caulobacter sp. NIBR1757 TaxID=3016000 RepID=UPI0022F022F8|nr:hypothetical protein [Caulobacter sp. NIBR1757]